MQNIRIPQKHGLPVWLIKTDAYYDASINLKQDFLLTIMYKYFAYMALLDTFCENTKLFCRFDFPGQFSGFSDRRQGQAIEELRRQG